MGSLILRASPSHLLLLPDVGDVDVEEGRHDPSQAEDGEGSDDVAGEVTGGSEGRLATHWGLEGVLGVGGHHGVVGVVQRLAALGGGAGAGGAGGAGGAPRGGGARWSCLDHGLTDLQLTALAEHSTQYR